MKNRTVIGIICMVLAIVITFAVAPIVNRLTSDTTEVVRLGADMKQGVKIEPEHLEIVTVKTDSIPQNAVLDPERILGKYSATALYAGDYLTEAKLAGEPNTASDAFASLDGSKVAISVTIDTFAAGLSGKLANGDVVSMIVTNKDSGKTTIPAELKYMKVITTTTSGGIDQDSIVKNEDGSYEIPSTVTLLCNTDQAKLLAKYDSDASLTVALVYRGTPENAKKFLDMQDEYFLNVKEKEDAEAGEDETEGKSGDDIIEKANDIINGNADYYDVNEAVGNDG